MTLRPAEQTERPEILVINCVLANGGDAAIFEAIKDTLIEATGGRCVIRLLDDRPAIGRCLYPREDIGASCFAEIWWYCRWPRLLPVNRFYRTKLVQLGLRLGRLGLGRIVCWALSKAERGYVDKYLAADVIVATGGTYLTEHYDLSQRAFDMANAIYAGKPLLVMPQSIGDIAGRPGARELAVAFRKAEKVFLRDKRSVTNLSKMMENLERIETVPDIVFRMSNAATKEQPRPARSSGVRELRQVAISVREWPFFSELRAEEGMKTYMAAMAALTDHLANAHEVDITFVSTCQGIPEYRYDDSQIAERIRSLCRRQDRIRIDSDFHQPRALMRLLASFDLVVATRMHMAILSLVAGTPVFPIAYEFKTTELFRALGYNDVVTIDRIGEIDLASRLESFLRDLPAIQRCANEAIEGFRGELQQVVNTVSQLTASTKETATA